jgi:hypothetical protein
MAKIAKREQIEKLPGSGISKWGNKESPKQVKLPSGAKLIFREDNDCILLYLGTKDISDKVVDKSGQRQPAGSVIYLVFYDGKKVVSTPVSYSLGDFEFEPDNFYYIHLVSEFKTREEFNPMKDFEIAPLGKENEIARVDPARMGVETIKLTLATVAEYNYTKLNYPLRPEPSKKL